MLRPTLYYHLVFIDEQLQTSLDVSAILSLGARERREEETPSTLAAHVAELLSAASVTTTVHTIASNITLLSVDH